VERLQPLHQPCGPPQFPRGDFQVKANIPLHGWHGFDPDSEPERLNRRERRRAGGLRGTLRGSGRRSPESAPRVAWGDVRIRGDHRPKTTRGAVRPRPPRRERWGLPARTTIGRFSWNEATGATRFAWAGRTACRLGRGPRPGVDRSTTRTGTRQSDSQVPRFTCPMRLQGVFRHGVKGPGRGVPSNVAIPQPRANLGDFLFGQPFDCALDLLNLAHSAKLQESLIRASRVFQLWIGAMSQGWADRTEVGFSDLATRSARTRIFDSIGSRRLSPDALPMPLWVGPGHRGEMQNCPLKWLSVGSHKYPLGDIGTIKR